MKKIVTVVVALVLGITALCVAGLAIGTTSAVTGEGCALAAAAATSATAPPAEQLTRWDAEQVEHATTILTVGQQLGVPPRGWVVALATAMQESTLRNLPSGDRDSLGLFQQRPSQGWGSREQIMDPAYAAEAFYQRLVQLEGWEQMPVTQAAQAVQRSALPQAYARWETDAVALAAAITGLTPEMLAICGAGGWMVPVHGPVVSGFRTAQRPDHDGVDIAAARGTTIRAAHTGTVVVATCNVDPAAWGCDRDGHPKLTAGCGWYVDIEHTGGIRIRYCHMLAQPLVTVGQQVYTGQPIGEVGSSGRSSGPHLHYEVHLPQGGPIDPEEFMASVGAELGDPQ